MSGVPALSGIHRNTYVVFDFDATHVPGAVSDATDGFSKWDQSVVHTSPARARPHVLCHV